MGILDDIIKGISEIGAVIDQAISDLFQPDGAEIVVSVASSDLSAFNSDGPGIHVTFAVESKESLAGAHLLLWPKNNGAFIKSVLSSYADGDGDAVAVAALGANPSWDAQGRRLASLYFPYAALPPAIEGNLDFQLRILADGVLKAEAAFSGEINRETADRANGVWLVCWLTVEVCVAGGSFKQEHSRYCRENLQQMFELSDVGLEAIRRYLKRAIAMAGPFSPYDFGRFIGALKGQFSADQLKSVLQFAVSAATAGGGLTREAIALVERFCDGFDLGNEFARELVSGHDLARHFVVLGLDSTCQDVVAVRRAYRAKLRECHPDRYSRESAAVQAEAAAKTRALRESYEAVLRSLAD